MVKDGKLKFTRYGRNISQIIKKNYKKSSGKTERCPRKLPIQIPDSPIQFQFIPLNEKM